MRRAYVHQILNYYTPPQALDPGFLVLDNRSNERPDWYEYWPIRRFLLEQALDEAALYGFLSPKFALKTNLDSAAVRRIVDHAEPAVEVILLSPSIHNSAHHWNVFDHGDAEHPGLKALAAQFFARIGRPTDLDALVTDSRNTVNSNFFLATPRFWRAWLEVNEARYAIAEDPSDPLGESLRTPVPYRGRRDVQMKIFLMERIATWILCRGGFVACARDPFASGGRFYKLPFAVICDALKIAYTGERRGQYRDVFRMMSGLRAPLNLQIRVGDLIGSRRVRPFLRTLAAYWSGGE